MAHRRTGYLANVLNIPPLIFRFQFNPSLLADKKSFKYVPANSFGEWGFDKTAAASGFFGSLGGIADDVKEISSLLVGVKPLKAEEGQDREFALDFTLFAGEHVEDLPESADHFFRASIEPDLAVLRSFMHPSWDLIDAGKMLCSLKAGKFEVQCWNKPPECALSYGGNRATCVMTSLNIKVIDFLEDATPRRAEVSVTLKEQPFSFSPLIDFATRHMGIALSYRHLSGQDLLEITPGYSTIRNIFD